MKYIYQNHFQDRSGNVVTSGNVTVYNVNTTNLATIYSSSGSSVVTGSVVTTGADGFFKFWVNANDYIEGSKFKIILSKTAFNSKTYDDIVILPVTHTYYYANPSAADQGVDNDDDSIADLMASIGTTNERTIVLRPGTYTVSTNDTITSNITLDCQPGAVINVGAGVTLTFDAGTPPPKAGNYQIFSGTGTVSGLSYVNPLWFGVVQDWNGTTGTDNATALAAAFNAVAAGGKLEFPPVINRGISYSSNVSFDPHLATLEGNHNVLKYTGAATAMTIGGDAAVIKNLTLIGNATGDIGFYHPNANTGVMENVQVFGGFTTAFKMAGPNHGLLIHCGVDANQAVVANDILTAATWGGNVTTGFWLFSLGGQNPEGLTFIDCMVTNNTKTGTGWDVDAGGNITLINCCFQSLTTGINIATGARVALINPWFESGTVDTEIVDADEASWTTTGLGLRIHNTTFMNKNFGSGNTLAMRVTSLAASAPGLIVYDDQSTRATGVAIRGDSKDGAGVYGVQTAPTGSVVAGEVWGGVVGKAASTATVGIGVRGQGADDVTSYAGYFEGGMLYTGSWNPKYRTVTDDTALGAVNDFLIYVNGAAKTMTLPTASSGNGQIITIKLIAAATTATVDGNGAETIDGAANYSLSAQYKYVTVQSNGSAWFIIGNN